MEYHEYLNLGLVQDFIFNLSNLGTTVQKFKIIK